MNDPHPYDSGQNPDAEEMPLWVMGLAVILSWIAAGIGQTLAGGINDSSTNAAGQIIGAIGALLIILNWIRQGKAVLAIKEN